MQPFDVLAPSAAAASPETPLPITAPSTVTLNGHRIWQVFRPLSDYQNQWSAWDQERPVVNYGAWGGTELQNLHAMTGQDIDKLPLDILLILFRGTIKWAENPVECIEAFTPSLRARKWKKTESVMLAKFIGCFNLLPRELALSEKVQKLNDSLACKWGDLKGIEVKSKYLA